MAYTYILKLKSYKIFNYRGKRKNLVVEIPSQKKKKNLADTMLNNQSEHCQYCNKSKLNAT